MTTRTFANREELMISLLNGEKWGLGDNTLVFMYDKNDKVAPFRKVLTNGDSSAIDSLYHCCDDKTIWTKVEEKTELDLMKEKYASGNYIYIYISPIDDKIDIVSEVYADPYIKNTCYKLIHKEHKDILDAYLADNDVEIEMLGNDFDAEWADLHDVYTGNFIDSYNEDFEYRLKPKKKTIYLAMFTCYDLTFKRWCNPYINESLEDYKTFFDSESYINHHEIPNTRYEQEIDEWKYY